MIKGRMRFLLLLIIWPYVAIAQTPRAGEFDYYVLALTWSPSWCAIGGDSDSAQCQARLGWALHGLWPQYEDGWPQDCRSPERDPSRAMTRDMADIMGSSGSAWHQWKKHGRCSGLSARAYFDLARRAYGQVERPEVLRRLSKSVKLPARVVEEAFLKDNPNLSANGLTVTCREGRIYEVRLCLEKDLSPRECGADIRRDCTLADALLDPIE